MQILNYFLFNVENVTSASGAATVAAWLWFAFTLPLLHHDAWTLRSLKVITINQTIELMTTVFAAIALVAMRGI